jgi:hypothetical protein
MICDRYADSNPNDPVRLHPYEGSVYGGDVDYYNFRESPELIREKLEDFKPFEHQKAIQRFYEGLEWLNSNASKLESNDSAFAGPRPNDNSPGFKTTLQCSGRVMVFYRTLPLNLISAKTDWLLRATNHFSKSLDPKFNRGALGLSFMDTAFVDLRNAIGKELQIQFWAFGDTEEETWNNLKRVFDNLFGALKAVSYQIVKQSHQAEGRKNLRNAVGSRKQLILDGVIDQS